MDSRADKNAAAEPLSYYGAIVGASNYPARWNGAPSQELLAIRRNHHTGELSLDPLRWGLIPYWCEDPKSGANRSMPRPRRCARCQPSETPIADGAASSPWTASSSGRRSRGKSKTALRHRNEGWHPFGLGGLWENWKDPKSGEWIRTFAIITTNANELVAEIHDRMPLIIAPTDFARWLSDEPDPEDLMRPYPAEPMRIWPISTRVNKPENADPSILKPIKLSVA